MKLVAQTAPYIRKNVSVKRMMLDVIIALLPVTAFAIIQNGWNSLYVILISLATMVVTELVAHAIMKWPKEMKFKELFTKDGFKKLKGVFTVNNFTAPIISALIYALIMPAYVDAYVVFIGAFFGMLVGKMIFGGLGSNIFNPAAVGRIFVGLAFTDSISTAYTLSDAYISAGAGATPLNPVSGFGNFTLLDLFLGNVPGCMGEVSKVLILVGALYLFIRKSADLRAFFGYLFSFGAVMLVACISGYGSVCGNVFEAFMYQMLSGGMLFGAVFMITDPVTSPTSKFGRVCYAAIAGCITAMIRCMGAYPEGVAFSILIANMLTPCIDYFMRGKPNTYTWKQILGLVLGIGLICCIVSASVMGGWF